MFFSLESIHPVWMALIAGIFTWFMTALGAAVVFFFRQPGKTLMDAMLGFASGVMIAASFWSLLLPALEMAQLLQMNRALIVSSGFLLGGVLLFLSDQFFTLKSLTSKTAPFQKRAALLMFSITMHNIPEGLAVGVGFGSVSAQSDGAALASACLLALGIGLQNFPEGTAVSVPLMREGFSQKKAFFYGQLSGAVEPISALIGALLIYRIQSMLPFLLSFAAGAMIYVVVEELIPESQTNKRKDFMALFTLIGFVTMMILDVCFS